MKTERIWIAPFSYENLLIKLNAIFNGKSSSKLPHGVYLEVISDTKFKLYNISYNRYISSDARAEIFFAENGEYSVWLRMDIKPILYYALVFFICVLLFIFAPVFGLIYNQPLTGISVAAGAFLVGVIFCRGMTMAATRLMEDSFDAFIALLKDEKPV